MIYEKTTNRKILSNQFYAALLIFLAPKRGGWGMSPSPKFSFGGTSGPSCSPSAAYETITISVKVTVLLNPQGFTVATTKKELKILIAMSQAVSHLDLTM